MSESAMPKPSVPKSADKERPPAPALRMKQSWRLASRWTKAAVVAVAVLAIVGVIGGGVATYAAVFQYKGWEAANDQIIQRDETITGLEADLKTSQAALLPQQQLRSREATVTARENALVTQSAEVQAREDAISAKEKIVKQTSLADGTYSVGVSMEPGTYRTTSTNTRCYWAIYVSGTNYDDIDQNDAGSTGVLTVTVGEGRDFRTQSCGTWTKVN